MFPKSAEPANKPILIANHTLEEYLNLVGSFHGYVAPGLLAGGFMVDMALRALPPHTLFNAFCETAKCLPDAVQLLTPCTIGNGWLTIMDFGRFGLCLYDKDTGIGVRVFLDARAIKELTAIQTWFFKLKPKEWQDHDLLFNEIKTAGESIYSLQHIQVLDQHLNRQKMGKRSICNSCGESYPAIHGIVCRACQGQAPYHVQNDREAPDSMAFRPAHVIGLSADSD